MIRKLISLLLVLILTTAVLCIDTALLSAGGGGEVDPTGLDTRNRIAVQVDRPIRDGATITEKNANDVRVVHNVVQMFYLRMLLRSLGL